jgi:hypothetical protein
MKSMMTLMMRKDGTDDPVACLVSHVECVEKSASRLRSLQHVGERVRKASRSPLAMERGCHVMMTLMMITISEPVTSRSR